tara:strand:+ start:2954 stop:3829 length:876 start_codon:yes stop_codon:yes gene_type:complete
MNIKLSLSDALLHGIMLLAILLLIGCNDVEDIDTLTFIPKYQNTPLKCSSSFNHQGKTWQYSQLQFFISEIEVKNSDGQWQTWPLLENKHQTSGVALLGEYCQTSKLKHKLKQENWQLLFEQAIDVKTFSQLRFTLGVPFVLNHQNPLLQPSPLNVPNMFWVWQTGHKFFRLDMKEVNEVKQKDNWQFHLGSTGCKAPSALRTPKVPCRNGNQTKIILDIKESSKENSLESIDVNLEQLFSGLMITRKNSCQSEFNNKSCLALFKNIGLVTSPSQDLFKLTKITEPESMSH